MGYKMKNNLFQQKEKIAWINTLSETGLSYIEVSSFVHPKWIPQLADAEAVLKKIEAETRGYICCTCS